MNNATNYPALVTLVTLANGAIVKARAEALNELKYGAPYMGSTVDKLSLELAKPSKARAARSEDADTDAMFGGCESTREALNLR